MTRSIPLTRSATLVAIMALLAALLIATPAHAAVLLQPTFSNDPAPTVTAVATIPGNRGYGQFQLFRPAENGTPSTTTMVAQVCREKSPNNNQPQPAEVTWNLDTLLPAGYPTGTWTVHVRAHSAGTDGDTTCGGSAGAWDDDVVEVRPSLTASVTYFSGLVEGSEALWFVRMTNTGGTDVSDAEDAELEFSLPDGLTDYHYCVRGLHGTCDSLTHYQSLSNNSGFHEFERYLVNRRQDVRFYARVPQGYSATPTYQFTATHKLGADGAAAQTPPVTESADLRLTLSRTGNGANTPVEWAATVLNRGPSSSTHVRLEVTPTQLADDLKYGIHDGQGCTANQPLFGSGPFTLEVTGETEQLLRHESETYCFEATALQGNGQSNLTVTASAATSDPIPSNNSATK